MTTMGRTPVVMASSCSWIVQRAAARQVTSRSASSSSTACMMSWRDPLLNVVVRRPWGQLHPGLSVSSSSVAVLGSPASSALQWKTNSIPESSSTCSRQRIRHFSSSQQQLEEDAMNTSETAGDDPVTLSSGSSSKTKKKKKKGKKSPKVELFRADRVLANRTGKSRSECFELLKQKRVWQVIPVQAAKVDESDLSTSSSSTDGKSTADDDDRNNKKTRLSLVLGPSTKLPMDAALVLDKKTTVPLPPPLLMVYHKPKWVLSVRSDPHYQRPCLDDSLLPHPQLHPVGRLDYDTSGLLLFSSSGALTQHLLHPKHGMEKTYVATVTGRVHADTLSEQLRSGVTTTEGTHTAVLHPPVQHLAATEVASYLQRVRDGLPEHYNQTDLRQRGYLNVFDATELSTVRLTVTEGKHRMVRRMLANCGHAVVSLKRERMGMIQLKVKEEEELPPGEFRELTPRELEWASGLLSSKKKKTVNMANDKNKQPYPKYRANPKNKNRHGRRRQNSAQS